MTQPVRWVRPAGGAPAEARWGHPDGLQVGLAPLPGPRGLLRVYAQHIELPRDRLINFVAVEPIPAGSTARGLSELEASALDGVAGKRFWSTDDLSDRSPRDPRVPASGVVTVLDGVERLVVRIGVERFENGAHVRLEVSFRADRPHEVAMSATAEPDSVPLQSCILSATMGNFARLRRLHLADGVVAPADLWPVFSGDGFTPHASFPLSRLVRRDGAAVVSAVPDETRFETAAYADGTNEHWRYRGPAAVQTWRSDDPHEDLVAQVNGRATYWASSSPIPGGVAYENFELVEPYSAGREQVLAVVPVDTPSASPDSRLRPGPPGLTPSESPA